MTDSAVGQYTQALARQYYAQMASRRAPATQKVASPAANYSAMLTGNSWAAKPANAPKSTGEKLKSGVGRIVDILSQPQYALTQLAKEGTAAFAKANETGSFSDRLKAIAGYGNPLGLTANYLGDFGSHNDKSTWQDVIVGKQNYVNDYRRLVGNKEVATQDTHPLAQYLRAPEDNSGTSSAEAAVGFLANVVGDPLSYIGAGEVKALAKPVAEKLLSTGAGQAAKATFDGSKLGQDIAKFNDLRQATKLKNSEKLASKLQERQAAQESAAKTATDELHTMENGPVETPAVDIPMPKSEPVIPQADVKPVETPVQTPTVEVPPVQGPKLFDESHPLAQKSGTVLVDTTKALDDPARLTTRRAAGRTWRQETTSIGAKDVYAAEDLSQVKPFFTTAKVPVKAAAEVSTEPAGKLTAESFLAQSPKATLPNGLSYEQAASLLKDSSPENYAQVLGLRGLDGVKASEIPALVKETQQLVNKALAGAAKVTEKAPAVESFTDFVGRHAKLTDGSPLSITAKEFLANARKFQALKGSGAVIPEAFVKRLNEQKAMLAAAHGAAVRPAGALGGVVGTVTRRTPVRPSAVARKDAQQAARDVAEARATTATRRRSLTPAQRAKWLETTSFLSPEHQDMLMAAQDAESFANVMSQLKAMKTPGSARYIEYDVRVLKADKKLTVPETTSDAAAASLEKKAAAEPILNGRQAADSPQEVLKATEPVAEDVRQQIASGANLSENAREAIRQAAEKQGMPEFLAGGQRAGFDFATNKGVARTAEQIGDGLAYHSSFNGHFVQNVWEHLINAHMPELQKLRAAIPHDKGAITANVAKFNANREFYQTILKPELRQVEDYLAANGVRVVATNGKDGIPLYLSQMLDAFETSKEAENFLYGHIFDLIGYDVKPISTKIAKRMAQGGEGHVGQFPITSIMQLGGHLAKIAAEDDVAKALALAGDYRALAKNLSGRLDNSFREAALGRVDLPNGEVRYAGVNTLKNGARVSVDSKTELKHLDSLASIVTDERFVQRLFDHISRNVADNQVQFGARVQSAAKKTIQRVLDTLDDTGKYTAGDAVDSLLFPERVAKEMTSDPTVAKMAAEKAKEKLGEVVPEREMVAAKAGKEQSDLVKNGEHVGGKPTTKVKEKRNEIGQATHEKTTAQTLKETPLKNIEDVTELSMQTNIMRTVDFLYRKFTSTYANMTMHNAIRQMGSVGGVMSRTYARQLGEADTLAKQIAKARGLTEVGSHRAVAKEAFDAIKAGKIDSLPADMAPLADHMQNLVDYMFDIARADGSSQSVLSTFFRNGFDLGHINSKLSQARFGLGEDMRLRTSGPWTVNGKKYANYKFSPEQIAKQWRSWKIDDPIDFLARMERVTTELATETAISREGARLAKAAGLLSNKKRPGFVKANIDSFGDKSILRYFPSKNGTFYVHPSLVGEIKRMDELLDMSANNPGLRMWLRQNLDPILAMWKSGMTIWRPGHHWRNIVGDTGMAYLRSGVKNPVYYARALKMVGFKQNALGRTFRGDYGVWDALAAMQGLSRAAEGGAFTKALNDEIISLAKPGAENTFIVARAKIGGKTVDLDAATVYQGMMDRGKLPDFRHQEDIIDIGGTGQPITTRIAQATGWQDSMGQKAMNGMKEKIAGFSEGRDDFVRLGHTLHLIENGMGKGQPEFKSLSDMFDRIAERIAQVHPDGTDLTPFESQTMRRLFPFYTWNRKAIPLVFENMLTHPGRFMMYPKAMYAAGYAAGVDLESLSNPFPQDQIFPSFVTDKMTGIGWKSKDGHYWSFDIGAPQADVLNSFLGNGQPGTVTGGILGLLNPALKVPLELKTKTQLQSGVPITDTSDYIDSNIPGLNVINSVFGKSPSSIIENALKGKLQMDSNRQVTKGNRGGVSTDPQYLANWATGLKFQDNSKPNYITLARLQAINKAKQGNQ